LIAGCVERNGDGDGLGLEDAVRAMMREPRAASGRKPE